MTSDEFKVGVFFIYNVAGHIAQLGIGEVLETEGPAHNYSVKIKWVWAPPNLSWTRERWYQYSHIASWEEDCTLITEQEKFTLFLKHNFG